jgi:hypothetical protein
MVDLRLVYRIECRRLRRAVDIRLRSWLILEFDASCLCVVRMLVNTGSKERRTCGDDMIIKQGRPPPPPPAIIVESVYIHHFTTVVS